MDAQPPLVTDGDALVRLDVNLLERFEMAVDGKGIASDRWPSLRATQLAQLLSLQPRLP